MSTEQEMQEINTLAFIAANVTSVVLTPRTREQQPNGAWKWQMGVARQPQCLRLIKLGLTNVSTGSTVTSEDGVQRRFEYQLLGPSDAVILSGDVFTFEGDWLEVIQVEPTNGYETRAAVTRMMKPPI